MDKIKQFIKEKKYPIAIGFLVGFISSNVLHFGAGTLLFIALVAGVVYTFPETTYDLVHKATKSIKKMFR